MQKVLGVVVMMIWVEACSGAGKVDHHTVKLHTAFLKDRYMRVRMICCDITRMLCVCAESD